jgi:magnesium chelatase family protein
VLFLDEAPEFGMSLLQSLREPIEDGWISIARAGSTVRYPALLQLVLAFNPCPCGNLGRDSHACICSTVEIYRYWRRVGGALLDRIDIRVPLAPVAAREMCTPARLEETALTRARIGSAVALQRQRYSGLGFSWNARIPPGLMEKHCALDARCRRELESAAESLTISSRAFHSVLRIARTIADLEGEERITTTHLMEALQHRRYGDGDYYWVKAAA